MAVTIPPPTPAPAPRDLPHLRHGVVIVEASHTVGLIWTEQPDAEICTWQHTAFSRDKHAYSRRDSNLQSQEASGRRPAPKYSYDDNDDENNNNNNTQTEKLQQIGQI